MVKNNEINDWIDLPVDDINDWEDVPIESNSKLETTQPSQPSQLESIARGAAQGVSMGFGDEIGAAVLSPLERIRQAVARQIPGSPESVDAELAAQGFTGDIQPQSTLDIYRNLRDTSREADAAAREANPYTFMAGEVVGGIAPALASGGAGVVANIGKTGLKQAAGKGLLIGGAQGAASGLGYSEADLTEDDFLGAARDTAIGAGIGGVMGGALPVVGAAAKGTAKLAGKGVTAVKEKVKDLSSEYLRRLGETYNRASQGLKSIGQKLGNESEEQLMNRAKEVTNIYQTSKKEANDIISKGLKGDKIDVSESLNLFDSELNQLSQKYKLDEDAIKNINVVKSRLDSAKLGGESTGMQYITGETSYKYKMTPQDFFDLQDEIRRVSNSTRRNESLNQLTSSLENVRKRMKDEALSLVSTDKKDLVNAGFKIHEDLHTITDTLSDNIGSKKTTESLAAQSSLKEKFKNITGFTTDARLESQPVLQEGFRALERISPKRAPSLLKEIEKAAQGYDISMAGQKTTEGVTKVGAVGKIGLAGASALGNTAHFVKGLSRLPSNSLTRLENNLAQKGKTKAAAFVRELSKVNEQSRSALVFSAMQNPELRKDIEEGAGFKREDTKE